jgi:hypothetical protein
MITLNAKGPEVVRSLSNASLWHEKDNSLAPYVFMYVSFLQGTLSFYSTDSYVAAVDSCGFTIPEDQETASLQKGVKLTEDDVDKFLLAARAVKTKDLGITLGDTLRLPYIFEQDDKGKWSISEEGGSSDVESSGLFRATPIGSYHQGIPNWVEAFDGVLHDAECCVADPASVFAIRPERFLKLSRVRADRDAPIDIQIVDAINPRSPEMAAIKIGPTFRAIVNFVDREQAKARLGDNAAEWMWA